MLGRTEGAFQENLTITSSDPAATLDAMLRMAENAKGVYELEADGRTEEGDTPLQVVAG